MNKFIIVLIGILSFSIFAQDLNDVGSNTPITSEKMNTILQELRDLKASNVSPTTYVMTVTETGNASVSSQDVWYSVSNNVLHIQRTLFFGSTAGTSTGNPIAFSIPSSYHNSITSFTSPYVGFAGSYKMQGTVGFEPAYLVVYDATNKVLKITDAGSGSSLTGALIGSDAQIFISVDIPLQLN